MKKFLALIVVLNMVSVANAALTWDVDSITLDIDEVEVVNIISDNSSPYTVSMGNDASTVAEIVNAISLLSGLYPEIQTTAIEGPPGWWQLTVWSEGVIPPGSHWEVVIIGLAEGSYSLNSDYYEDAGSNDILSITVIPEPMTISLLALGVLALLRKRRP